MIVKDPSDPEFAVLPKLGFFLASKDQFSNDLKKSLSAMSGTYADILTDMINLCVDHLEKGLYVIASTKHAYLRAIALAIFLLDGEGDEMDFNKKKKIKVEKIIKLFKVDIANAGDSYCAIVGGHCTFSRDLVVQSTPLE